MDLAEFACRHTTIVQSLLFGATIVAAWSAENASAPQGRVRKRRRARVNALFVLPALPIQVGMTMICVALAYWVTAHSWGLVTLLPMADHPLVKYGLMFVVLDFLDYVYHRTMHHVPVLWRLHLVHHTDQAVDASTTVREHPGETFVRNLFLIAWVLLCGASIEILVLRQTVETVANILAHTSFRLTAGPARLLGWLLVTPNLHHVHHHRVRPYTDRNYGDVFIVWDRLFGTFATLAAGETVFGLDTHASKSGDDGFLRAMAMPFDRVTRSVRPRYGLSTSPALQLAQTPVSSTVG